MAKINFPRSIRILLFAKNILLSPLFIFFLGQLILADDISNKFERYPSGQLKSETVGRGAEKNSTTTYFENGQKRTELLLLEGKKNVYTEWFESGTKKEEVHYKNGELSKMTSWTPSGTIDSISTFASDGTRHDTFYYPNGNKKLEQSTRDRKPAGTWTRWSSDGQITSEKTYEEKEEVDSISDQDMY